MLYTVAIGFVAIVALFVIAHAVRIRNIEERSHRAPRFFILGIVLLLFMATLFVLQAAGL